jgi:RNA polymerase sigma-70 factor (ECF subfamily)
MDDFNAIVSAHGEAVWRTAYRLLNHREDALDCYQDTFLAAVELSDNRPVEHWRTLLVRIATRRAMDRLRRRYQSKQVLQAAADSATVPRKESVVEARMHAEELRELVRQALAQLPPPQAEAFWLRHLEQLSVAEIARQMQLAAGHVRVLVHRAAVALRERLGETYGPASIRGELP